MKVFFNYLIATSALIAGFTSCSNDDDLAGKGGNPTPNGKATTFTLSIAQPKTYAVDMNATADENKMTSVDVFIFNDSDVLEKRERLASSDFSSSTDNEYTANRTIATTVGAKKIYVGVNLSDELARDVASRGLTAIYQVSSANDLMNPANGFAMFSKVASNPTFVEETDATAATANKVSATVSRLLAKVAIEKGAGLQYNVLGGTVSDLQFSLSNITKLYYVLPNALNYSPTNTLADFYKENSYKAVNANGTAIKTANVSYALENISTQSLEGYSTYASIRAKFLPTKVVKLSVAGNGSSGLVSETAPVNPQTFYVVSNAGVKYYFIDQIDAAAYDATINGATPTMSTYQDGYCFYKAYLNPAHNYNIFRNNLYKVNITAINGLGQSGDNIDNPGHEISKPTNITIDIVVEPWAENTQDSEIL